MAMKVVLVLLVLCAAYASAQIPFTSSPAVSVGTATPWVLSTQALTAAAGTPSCSNGLVSTIDPCQVQQFTFTLADLTDEVESATQWISFRFRYAIEQHDFIRAFDYSSTVSIHYGETSPGVDEPSNILNDYVVSPFKLNEVDGEYEWNLHCSFNPGLYTMTVRSASYVQSYNSSLSANVTNATEAYPFEVQICAQSVPVEQLAGWSPFCDGQCLRSVNGPFTVQSFRDQYAIGAPEHLSAHFAFVAPTATELGDNELSPGLRLRVFNRVDRADKDFLGLWVVTVKRAEFTSAAFAHPNFVNGYATCPWDFASGPELRFTFDYEQTGSVAYQPDGIDIWIPRCTLEVGQLYYVSVLPPHTESLFDYDYTFDLTIEVDQLNPAAITTLDTGVTASFDDQIEGFLVPFGQVSDVSFPERRGQSPPHPVLPGSVGYPLSLPLAPLSLWDDGNGPVDRYERAARWYALELGQIDAYSSLNIVLSGAQWGRRTDDGQWNQLAFNSLTPPGDDFYDYAKQHLDTLNITQDTWLRPQTLDAAMQRFEWLDVDSMRNVDVFVSTAGLPLGELHWVSELLRYQNYPAPVQPWFEPVPLQNATGWPNATLENHYGTYVPLPDSCPTAEWRCTAYPDRQHKAGDASTSSCRITMPYCQLLALQAANVTTLYVGVAPTNLIWAEQDRVGQATVGPAAPYEGETTTQVPPRIKNLQTQRIVTETRSGNTRSPSSGNWDLVYTLQDMDLRFHIDFAMEDNTPTALGVFPQTDSAVESSLAQQGEVDYYTFSVANQTNNLTSNFSSVDIVGFEIELYTQQSAQNVWIGVYYFGDADPLQTPCPVLSAAPLWQCSTANTAGNRLGSCVFVEQGCDFEAGNYLLAVSAVDDGEANGQQLAYTLKASYLNPVVDLPFEQPTNQIVRTGSYNHYIFDVPADNQTVALRVHIGDVQGGKVTAYLRYGGPAGDNQCLLFDFKCQPSGGYHECNLVAPYCIDGAGQYYVAVYGEDNGAGRSAAGQIAYVLTAYVHRAEWVDWMPAPDANDPASAVHITRSIPSENTYAGIVKFADDIVKTDVRYNFWNDNYELLNPALPGLRQPVVPVAGFRPFGYLSFGMYNAGPNAVLAAEAHYYYFELSAAAVAVPNGTSQLVSSVVINSRQAHGSADTLTLYVSPYAIANDMCNCWSCVASPGEQSYSHCDIVLQQCDLLADDNTTFSGAAVELWYLTVRYDQYDQHASLPVDYTLDVQLKGSADVQLADGVAVYGAAASNEYQHYFFVPAASTGPTSLNVEFYIARDAVDQVEFTMNVDQRAGSACSAWGALLPSCEPAPVTQGNSQASYQVCSFKLHPCEFDANAVYWFSVVGTPEAGASQFGNGDVEYTLRVWTEAVAVLDALVGTPVSGVVAEASNVYSVEITADFFDAASPRHLFIQLDGIIGGQVRTWLSNGVVGTSCSESNACPGDRRPFDGEFEIELDNCQLTAGDVYYLVVSATAIDDPLTPVRYALRAYTQTVDIVPVGASLFGRDLPTPAVSLSLERLETVSLQIDVAGALQAELAGLTAAQQLAVAAASSLHVRVFDVTWGSFEYWVSQLPSAQGTTSFGSYPFGLASPECNSQYGGITGQAGASEPDIEHVYSGRNQPLERATDFDAVRTFGYIPPDELYLRLSCDIKSLSRVYVTLKAAVTPEWHRLPCDRTLNASVEVWLETPTLLVAPGDVWTFSVNGATDHEALTWVQAPENLTVFGDESWPNNARLLRPTQLIWSRTYADEYKLFAYPIDFSQVESVGIYLTADRKVAPSFDYPRNPRAWGGLGIPKDTVFGDSFLYYWLFVPTSQLQSTVGNTAVPGRIGDSCGFAPEHVGLSNEWDIRSVQEPLVLTACEYDYEPGVFFLAVRYPVDRPLAPYVSPAVAVAWQFPNTVVDEAVVEQFPALPTAASLLATNLDNTIRLTQNYTLGTYDQLDLEIEFPADYDTSFPYWSYTVRVTKLFKGSQSVPLMAWQYGSAVDLVPLPVSVTDSTTTSNGNNLHSDNEYLRGASYQLAFDGDGQCADYFDFAELPFVQIGGNTPCCRQTDLSDSRSLWLSFANSRRVLLQRDAPVPPIDDQWDEFVFEVTVVLTPFYLANVPLYSTEAVTIGQDNWVTDRLYMLRTYQFQYDPAAGYFNFDALLLPDLNALTPALGDYVVSAWLSYETPLFNPPQGFGNFLDSGSCFYGGELICTLDLALADSNNQTYPNNAGSCAARNACRSGPAGTYYLTFRWNVNDYPGSVWPQEPANNGPDANFAWRLWQSDNVQLDLSTVDHDSTTGLLPAFEVTSPAFDVYQNFEITLPSPDPTTDYSRFVYQNPSMLWFEVSYTNTSEFYAQSCAQLQPVSGDCLSGLSLELLGWNCTNFVFDANNYNYNCTLRCEIPLCVLDGMETLHFSVGNFDSNLHNASDLTFTAGIDSYLDRAQPLTDGVYFSVNATEANLTDVEYQFYFDYVPAANPAAELAYLEFALQNVTGWFADGVQVVLRVWPEYLCETTVQARTCSAVPQSYDRFGPASCLISFDPCEFDQTRPARFFVSATIGVDNNTVTIGNPAFGLWNNNFTYDVLAATRYPTLIEDALTLDTTGSFSTGYVLFNSQELGSEQHHYRFDLANFAADYDSLEVCVSVSCEAAESVSPYKWELELNRSSVSDGNWTPPFEPYLTVRQPVSLRSNQYTTVTESFSTFEFVATYSGHASLHAFLYGDNATTTESHVTLYLYQYEFNASSPLENLVSAQLIWRRHTVQLTTGVPYVLVASSQEPLHQYAFSVKYLYDPIVDFSVNARYFNWQNHWATPACNEFSAGLYGATKWEPAQSSACYTLSACEVQSGDLYVSLVTHNRPYPFLAYDSNVNNDVRYELTVTGTARPKPQLVPVNQWATLDQLQTVGSACSNSLRTEIVVPLTGLEWGNVVTIEARTSTGAQLVRACPRWRNSNLFSVLDAANPLDHASAEFTPNAAGNDVQGGPCDDYSQCTLLTATASQLSADEYYYSGVLTPCHFDNAELYVAFETSDANTVVRVSLDNGRVPVYDLTGLANPLAGTGAPQQQAAGQWQFYKLVLPDAPVELSVSLLDRVGGDSLQLTLSADASVPLLPGDSCFDLTANCPANSDVDCSITVPWCESSGTTAYYVGVYARSTVDAIATYSLQASLFPDELVQLAPCAAQCFNVAKGTVAYVELTSPSPLHESLVLFDVRDLTGVVEIAVQQDYLPGAHPDCHIGASWLIDSSDYTGDDVVPGDLRFFKSQAYNPFGDIGFNLAVPAELAVLNQTLASYDLYPDARSFAHSRDAAEFSAFRYALPCLDDAVTYLAFYAHEDATFSFTYRVESLITAANTLVIPTGELSTEIGWRSSPLEGFVENHLVPFRNSLLNDFSACSRALAQSGQWPHLYKWDYTSVNAAARQSFGWNLVFLQNAELTTLNRGVLVVNENRVAAPVLAAAAEQNPDTPGLNPLALALAHLDGCSVYPPEQDVALLQPAEEWSYSESCDLTARTFYFYVLFDYNNDQLLSNSFPQNTTDGRFVSEFDGTTSSFTSTVTQANPWSTPGSTFTSSSTSTSSSTTTETRSTTISSTASYSTTGAQVTSTQTTTDSSTFGVWPSSAFSETSTNGGFATGYSFEYVLTVELGAPASTITVGSAPVTVRQCSNDDAATVFVIDQGTTSSFAPLGIQLSAWTNGVTPVLRFFEDTCDSATELPTAEQCNTASFVAKPDSQYWFEVDLGFGPSNCPVCVEYVLEAFWDTDAVPSLYIPTVLTGAGPVFEIDDAFAVTSFNLATPPVATYALPDNVDLIHVRLAALTGQNVLASLSYAAATASPFAGCSAQFDQTPFYTDDFDNYWLRRQLRESNSTNYAHGLYGECEIYLSPDQLADYAQRATGASFFLSALLDLDAPLGIDIASLYADYHIEVTTGFTPLPAAATTYALSGLDRDFFSLSIANPASVVISVTAISGPAIKFSVRDSMFADDADWVFGPIWCAAQTCDVELNALSQLPTADTLYVFIDRGENRWQKDSVYSIGSSVGSANSVPYNATLDSLPFCSVIQTVEPAWFAFDSPNTAAWDYGDFAAKDDEAAALYDSIIGQFWGRPSAECVQALAVWSCFQTIREVDADGFVLPVCAEQCYDVVAACGEWTTSAALPQFDCGSTRYVHDDTDTVPCSGSNNRTIPFVPPPPFYINGTNTTSFVYSLSTTTGTTTTTTSSTSSTTTTGTDGHITPYTSLRDDNNDQLSPKEQPVAAKLTTAHRSASSFGFLPVVAVVAGVLVALALVVLAVRKIRRA